MLLALVFGVVLVLVGVTASALVAVDLGPPGQRDAERRRQPRRVAGRAVREREPARRRPRRQTGRAALGKRSWSASSPRSAAATGSSASRSATWTARDRQRRAGRHRPPGGSSRGGRGRGRRRAARRARRSRACRWTPPLPLSNPAGMVQEYLPIIGAADAAGRGRAVARRGRSHGQPGRRPTRRHARHPRRGGAAGRRPVPRLPRRPGAPQPPASPAGRGDATGCPDRHAQPRHRRRRCWRRRSRPRGQSDGGSAWRSWTSTTSVSSTTPTATTPPTRCCSASPGSSPRASDRGHRRALRTRRVPHRAAPAPAPTRCAPRWSGSAPGCAERERPVRRLRAPARSASASGICVLPRSRRIGHRPPLGRRRRAGARRRPAAATAVRVAATGEEERVVAGSFDVLQGLVIAVDTKDRYTKRHSEDVARYAVFLAQRMGLDEETQQHDPARRAAPRHRQDRHSPTPCCASRPS